MTREEAEKRLEAAKEDLAGAEKALATLVLDGANLALGKELVRDLGVRVFSRTVDLADAMLAAEIRAKAPNPAQDATEAARTTNPSFLRVGWLSAQDRALLARRDEEWCQALWPMDVNESRNSVVTPVHAENWMKLARGYWLDRAHEAALAEDRVREIHRMVRRVFSVGLTCMVVYECSCCQGAIPYPCPTIRALEGK